jgi:hypothetical protein
LEDTRKDAHRDLPSRRVGQKVLLAVSLLFVLAAVSVSTWLVAYTAWGHDLRGGLFALTCAVLGARAVLSWVLWLKSGQPVSSHPVQRGFEARMPADQTLR